MTQQNKLMIEHIAKAIFDHEQNRPFPPRMVNMMLYGQHPVTWEFINDPRFVESVSNQYRDIAQVVIEALNSYKPMENDIIAIEVYDDEIRVGGQTIWRGSPRYKSQEEVDAIVREWQNRTKTTDGNELPTGFEYGNHLTD